MTPKFIVQIINLKRITFGKKEHYYVSFYFHKERYARMSHFRYKSFTESRKTWEHASELCRSAGGTLPILRSKEELDELITLLKVGKGLAAVEFIFIGLAFNIPVGVCNIIYSRNARI